MPIRKCQNHAEPNEHVDCWGAESGKVYRAGLGTRILKVGESGDTLKTYSEAWLVLECPGRPSLEGKLKPITHFRSGLVLDKESCYTIESGDE